MAAAVRDDDPVMFLEEKALYPTNGEVPEGEHVDELGTAQVRRDGADVTIVALGTMVHRALAAAEQLAAEGTDCEVIDLRSLVPLDVSTVAALGAEDGPALHRRRKPPAVRMGGRGGFDHCRRVLLRSGRSHPSHHGAPHPVAGGGLAGGRRDPVGRAGGLLQFEGASVAVAWTSR